MVIKISEDLKIRVGRLGEGSFKEGDYIYIGSAKGCLGTRLQRHLRKKKKTYWHIDYLLKSKKTKILQIWIFRIIPGGITFRLIIITSFSAYLFQFQAIQREHGVQIPCYLSQIEFYLRMKKGRFWRFHDPCSLH